MVIFLLPIFSIGAAGHISNTSLNKLLNNKLLNICKALGIKLGKLVGDDITNTFFELPPSTVELIKTMYKLNYNNLDTISKDLIPLIKDFNNKNSEPILLAIFYPFVSDYL